MNHEDYTKIVDSTEKVLEEVDKEILKISEAALKSQKLEGSDYVDLMRIRVSIAEYLKDVRTDLLRAKMIESLTKEYEGYIATHKERVKSGMLRRASSMSDEDIKFFQDEADAWIERQNQELANKILEIKLSPL